MSIGLFFLTSALGIVTPWGGTVVPFYEVGRERSEPGDP